MTETQSDIRSGYIPAIDGMRAVAVGSVILFHLWPGLLPGGFTGVDIFFAISGFVVTGSVLGKRFDTLRQLLAWFYARRLLRIMPALIVMLLVTIVAADLFIPDSWLSNSTPHVGEFAFFGLSNVVLATDTDSYFGPQAAYNPFTHTWSLGVEEQFYLLFPILIYWQQRRRGEPIPRRQALWLIAALTLGSLAISAALSQQAHRYAFYLIFPRFWELGVGMLLCLTVERWRPRIAGPRSWQYILGLSGAGLIVVGLAIPENGLFPFPLALLPILGTAALIAAVVAAPRGATARLLGTRPMVAVGRVSYSLYLWHWPVFVLFRWTVGLETLQLQLLALAIACTFATFSYFLVERPLRTSVRLAAIARPKLVRGALAIMIVAGALGTALFQLHERSTLSVTGNRQAWYAEPDRVAGSARNHCQVTIEVTGFIGGKVTSWTPSGCSTKPAGFAVFALGDSHNLAYYPAYGQLAAELGVPVRAWFRSGCPILKLNEAIVAHGDCDAWETALLAEVRAKGRSGDVVFLPGLRITRLTNQFEHDQDIIGAKPQSVSPKTMERARATLGKFVDAGLHPIFEAPKPLFRSPPFRCADWFNRANPICRGGLTIRRAELEERRKPVVNAMQQLAAAQPALTIWDPFPLLCPGETCEAIPGGQPLFFDGDHLSGAGNDLLYPSLRDTILRAAQADAPG